MKANNPHSTTGTSRPGKPQWLKQSVRKIIAYVQLHKKMIGGSVVALFIVAWVWPLPAGLSGDVPDISTRILDRSGKELYTVQRGGRRDFVPLDQVSDTLIKALIAVEDRTFYSHHGLSIRGITRAVWRDIQAGAVVEGGSTITQQLVRNILLPQRRGFLYKLREGWLALKVDARMDKKEILERYLNTAYFGQQAYGIASASHVFFSKDLHELSTSESAFLVGLLNAPSSLNPFKNTQVALQRRSLVLRAMRDTSLLNESEFAQADEEPLRLSHGKSLIKAPHFVMWLLQEHPGIETKKEIRTTIDLSLQEETERIIADKLEKLKDKNVTSAAVVVLDAKTGEVLTFVGSADYFNEENDGAVNVAVAARQPGSALKPFTYALGLQRGMTAATTIIDAEAQFLTGEGNPYTPRNYDFGYHGLVRVREALGNSYNIPAIKTAERVGVATLLHFLQRTGLTTLTESPEHYGLALTLGDSEVKLLELTRAFGIFARAGKTLNEKVFVDEKVEAGDSILDPRIAWLITDIMSDDSARIAEFGKGGPLSFSFPVAAKTGTTRNSRDNWTIGYTPSRIVGVWVGNADNSPMQGTSGVTGAGPIFHDVLLAAVRGLPQESFVRPSGITEQEICRLSGKLPTPLCPSTLTEKFIAGTEPTEKDEMFVEVAIDSRNGLKATDTCPSSFVRKEVFAVFPVELKQWAIENGWKQIPVQTSPLCSGGSATDVPQSILILNPQDGSTYTQDPLIPDAQENIAFGAAVADASKPVEWFVDGVRVGTATVPPFRYLWHPSIGSHIVEARTAGATATAKITVVK